MADLTTMKPRIDADGVRVFETPGVRGGVWVLVVGLVLLSAGVYVLLRPERERPADEPARPQGASVLDQPRAAAGTRPRAVRVTANVAGAQSGTGAPAAPRPQGGSPDQPLPEEPAGEAATRDAAAEPSDEPSGIALFPPPGTKPLKRGLVVPEGFELPEGYVRHYQTADDGTQLPPVLMLHPDYQLLGADGQPISLTDRLIPPEYAPLGMPIQTLDVPETHVPMIEVPEERR